MTSPLLRLRDLLASIGGAVPTRAFLSDFELRSVSLPQGTEFSTGGLSVRPACWPTRVWIESLQHEPPSHPPPRSSPTASTPPSCAPSTACNSQPTTSPFRTSSSSPRDSRPLKPWSPSRNGQPNLTSLSTCAIIYRLRLYLDDRLRHTPRPGCHQPTWVHKRRTVL